MAGIGTQHPGRRGSKFMWGPHWQYRHYNPESAGESRSGSTGSGYQGYGQNQYQNYPNYMQQPYYSYGGGTVYNLVEIWTLDNPSNTTANLSYL